MLSCPFCEADLSDAPLQSGRCPACGGVMAWQDDEPQPPQRQESVGDERAASGPVANGMAAPSVGATPPSVPVAADRPAVAISETTEIPEPVIPPETATSAGGPPTRDRHSTIRVNDVGTVDEDEIQKTTSPQPPAGEAAKTVRKLWSKTISPGAQVRHTVKTQESLPVQPVSRRVPTREVRNEKERDAANADYRLLDIIGEGGVGIVYAAQQTSVDRTVALKMLRSEITQDWEQRQKFLSEAVVTGDLDHPNIVPIYELGSGHDGALFYAMKRVSGTPWSDVLLERPQEENLEILMKVADAIAFAHSRGVVHRDLKPENVMLGGFGEVQVMDWGIALPTPQFHRAANILTTGSLGGTPAYMAPEMATGPISRIGPASDVYLLGGLLYEIVTGQTPHSGADVMACLHAAAANEIQPTQKFGELLDIALKAMRTNPADRYESVQDFQAAIREYQSHTESIALSARADDDLRVAVETRDYQDHSRALFAFQEAYALWKGNHRAAMGITAAQLAYAQCALDKGDFDLGLSLLDDAEPTHSRARARLIAAQNEREARQQRLKAMKRTAIMLVLVLFVVVGSGLVIVRKWQKDAVVQKDRAEEEAARARNAEQYANVQRKEADKQRRNAEDEQENARASARAEKTAAEKATKSAEFARRQSILATAAKLREELAKNDKQYENYIAQIALAAEKIEGNAFDDARRLLDAYRGSSLRDWEWARLQYVSSQSIARFRCGGPVDSVAFSPDGKEFAVGGQDGFVRIWPTSLSQPAAGQPKPRLAISHTASGRRVPVLGIAWTQGLIATVGEQGSVHLWKPADGALVKSLDGHKDAVTSVVFSTTARHNWLVTGAKDGTVIVWDAARLTQLFHKRPHSWWVWDVAVSGDQKYVASAGQDGKILIWNVDERSGTPALSAEPKELAGYHNGPVYSIAFSPDGERIVSGGFDNRVLVWNHGKARSVNLQGRLEGDPEPTPDWLVLRGHTAPVRSVDFSPVGKGNRILSCGDDNTIRIWNAATGELERTLRGHGSFVRSAAFAPAAYQLPSETTSDRLVLSGGHDGYARLWRTAGYDDVRVYGGKVLNGHDDEVLAGIYSPDGRVIATAGKDRTIRLWDPSKPGTARVMELKEGHEYLATSALFFRRGPHAGRQFVTSGMDGRVRIWQVDSGTEIASFRGAGSSGAIALSHDNRELAACGRQPKGGSGYPILIWPVADLSREEQKPQTLLKHTAEVTALAYSPDGSRLISGDADGTCYVWDRTAGGWGNPRGVNGRAEARPHSKRITGVAVLDARRAATASNDRTVSIWDLTTGGESARITAPDSVISMDASSDGGRIVITTSRARPRKSDAESEVFDSTLQIYRSDAQRVAETTLENTTVNSVRFSPDDRSVLVMADRGRVFEWTPGTPAAQRLKTSEMMWTAVYARDGKQVLTVGGRRADLWNWPPRENSRRPVMSFGPHASVSHLSFSKDGRRLASADVLGTVKVWDVKRGRAEQILRNASRSPGSGPAIAALFSPQDDNLLFAVGETTVRPWRFDAASQFWKPAESFPIPGRAKGATAGTAAISSDGAWLVIGFSDGSAVVCSTRGEFAATLNGRHRHTAAVLAVAVSADNRWIVTGSEDKSAIVWEQAPDGRHWDAIAKLTGHPAPVNAVGLSRNRYRVLTGSEDKTAKIWDTRRLAEGEVAEEVNKDIRRRQNVFEDLRAVGKHLNAAAPGADGERKQRLVAQLEKLRKLTGPVSGPDEVKDVNRRASQLVERLVTRLDPDKPAPKGDEVVIADDPTEKWNWQRLRETSKLLRRLLEGPEGITEILTLRGHQRGLTAVTFSPNGTAVLTGSRDGKAIVWPSARDEKPVAGKDAARKP